MLFIANALPFNGGTTFILRLCRELSARGKKVGVLVLFDEIDRSLEEEIKKYAEVYYLQDFAPSLCRFAFKSQLGSFLPLNFNGVDKVIEKYGRHVHVMGVFGLLFIARYLKKGFDQVGLSVGIYHQNEFMFSGVDYYFANQAKKIFSSMDSRALVFFNEASRSSYSKFFGKNYLGSSFLPVGVALPDSSLGIVGSFSSNRIVSIGNLHNFKTYNKHVISCMPYLLSFRPDLMYEIYGEGDCRAELELLAVSLGVSNFVQFKGTIAYEDMGGVLRGALLFVGSGTAIVEASALGIPSVIGIESSLEPVTYGVLGDVSGFTYHEMVPGREVISIKDLILSLIEDFQAWEFAAISCQRKASEFSVVNTANGFIRLSEFNVQSCSSDILEYSNGMAFFSFGVCLCKHILGVDVEFSNRRNQGAVL